MNHRPLHRQGLLCLDALLLLGILLRTAAFFRNPSLWLDESMLALNIVHRSFLGLLHPLDYNQGCPILYLWITKLFTLLFGVNEYSLRLTSYLAGIGSLFVFHRILRKNFSTVPMIAGMAIFVLSPHLIRYSAECKQYIFDVVTTSLVVLVTTQLLQDSNKRRSMLVYSAVTLISVWASHAIVFTLAASLTVLFLSPAFRQQLLPKRPLIVQAILIGVSFLVNYFCFLRNLTGNSYLNSFWTGGYMPHSRAALAWLTHQFSVVLTNSLGIGKPFTNLALILCVLGIIFLVRNRLQFGLLLSLPICFALFASALNKYPFDGRLILFVLPLLILLMIAPIEHLLQRNTTLNRGEAVLLLLLLVGSSLSMLIQKKADFQRHEEIRPVLEYLAQRTGGTDNIYVYYSAIPQYRFYTMAGDLPRIKGVRWIPGNYVRQSSEKIQADLSALRGKGRVWFVFSHNWNMNDPDHLDEFTYFQRQLDKMGRLLDSVRADGSQAVLYEL